MAGQDEVQHQDDVRHQDDVLREIQRLKSIEQTVGFKPTGNFSRGDAHKIAYYRCYYTGLSELPQSYNELRLRRGTKDGCSIDPKKYDVFFYPVEAVATGHVPVTQSLLAAPAERVAAVVPHEDFHAQLHGTMNHGGLPDAIEEAAATLVGLATAGVAINDVAADVDLFLLKAELINRYYDRLAGIYASQRLSKHRAQRSGTRLFIASCERVPRCALLSDGALREKRELLASLEMECGAIRPAPHTFDACVSAPNNAGLAFDHTYTQYYPLLYRVFRTCERDLACTISKLESAPRKKSAAEVVAYFTALALPGVP